MRSATTCIALRRVGLVLALVPATTTAARAQGVALHGHVADSTTGEPLAGVRIEARAGPTVAVAFTDPRGRYQLANRPNMIGHAKRHRWRTAQRFVDPA